MLSKKMQKMFSFMLAAVLITGVASIGGGCFSSNADTDLTKEAIEETLASKQKLQFDGNGEFKILVCSDLHGDVKKSHKYIKALVDEVQPNMVFFDGDNTYVETEEELKYFIDTNMGYLEEKKIPWAHVYGNHDVEYAKALTKERIQEIYETYNYCLSKKGPDISGVGNFVIPIYSSGNPNKIAYTVWGLDSNMYLEDNYKGMKNDAVLPKNINGGCSWDYIKFDQVQWYQNASAAIEKYTGAKVPGIMFFHIPLPEMNYIHPEANRKKTGYGVEDGGQIREMVNCSEVNSGMFAAILSRGDICGIINGHDHLNDFSGTYLGVKFAYTPTMGHVGYRNEDVMAARVVTIKEADPKNWKTYLRKLKGGSGLKDIYDYALDVVYPEEIKNPEEPGKTNPAPVPAELNQENMLFSFDDGFEAKTNKTTALDTKSDLIAHADADLTNVTYYTGGLDCDAEGVVPFEELPVLEVAAGGRNGQGLKVVKPAGGGFANGEFSVYLPDGKSVPYKGEKYLRMWVDFTEMDFRMMGLGLVTDKGVRYSTSNNIANPFLPIYMLSESDKEWNKIPAGDLRWRAYQHGGNGRFGAGQNCSVYNFKGWIAIRVSDFLGWEGPSTNSHYEAVGKSISTSENIKGFYVVYDLLAKSLREKPFYMDEIELVNDYTVFEAK